MAGMSNPGPQGLLSCMFYLFFYSNPPDLVIVLPLEVLQKLLITIHLYQVEQKNL